ncbi:hypothetical protein OG735_40770 [Streptomyces sp. NBC_01210]|uniref:hypothetical protein n=1 Tax=Streptomyces sp. NBC_01210 TaxID=2903774 RepID=UPI002E0DBB66|nr:hypothetical protein OG735_40770 [Streptomyces sp. NBC_01210]
MRALDIDRSVSTKIENFVNSVLSDTPSQSDMRFAEHVLGKGRDVVPALAEAMEEAPWEAVLLRGLPALDDVAQTKILTLLLTAPVG